MKQLYGATETCAYVCLQPDGDIKLDSVGKPAQLQQVKNSTASASAGFKDFLTSLGIGSNS